MVGCQNDTLIVNQIANCYLITSTNAKVYARKILKPTPSFTVSQCCEAWTNVISPKQQHSGLAGESLTTCLGSPIEVNYSNSAYGLIFLHHFGSRVSNVVQVIRCRPWNGECRPPPNKSIPPHTVIPHLENHQNLISWLMAHYQFSENCKLYLLIISWVKSPVSLPLVRVTPAPPYCLSNIQSSILKILYFSSQWLSNSVLFI